MSNNYSRRPPYAKLLSHSLAQSWHRKDIGGCVDRRLDDGQNQVSIYKEEGKAETGEKKDQRIPKPKKCIHDTMETVSAEILR